MRLNDFAGWAAGPLAYVIPKHGAVQPGEGSRVGHLGPMPTVPLRCVIRRSARDPSPRWRNRGARDDHVIYNYFNPSTR